MGPNNGDPVVVKVRTWVTTWFFLVGNNDDERVFDEVWTGVKYCWWLENGFKSGR